MASVLIEKSKQFALHIIKVCNEIKKNKHESVLTNQLIRSGTSIGANIREAFYAHGRADFVAKLQIALKECSESEYWLELLIESGYTDNKSILYFIPHSCYTEGTSDIMEYQHENYQSRFIYCLPDLPDDRRLESL